MYAMVGTRPDIAWVVGKLCQQNAKPAARHLLAAKRVMRYLSDTKNYGIIYRLSTELSPVGYCDSDYASEPDSRRSISGYIFTVAGGAVSWASRRQRNVTTSSTEAEYVSMATAAKTAKWLRALLADVGYVLIARDPVLLHVDNRGALAWAKDPIDHSRSKHVDVQYHWVRELVQRRIIEVQWVKSSDMHADFLTKPLSRLALAKGRDLVRLQQMPTSETATA